MRGITRLVRPFFTTRYAALLHNAYNAESTQRRLLAELLTCARNTAIGAQYKFHTIKSYTDFASALPVIDYHDMRPDAMRMIAGEANILWPGRCARFAQSSGTGDGRSKYIPITNQSLQHTHYQGSFDAMAAYLAGHPDSRVLDGKNMILGGSFANTLSSDAIAPGIRVGDLSANLIDNINPLVNLIRTPDKATALLSDWSIKLPALISASRGENVTGISGVPSWFLTLITELLREENAATLHEVWPNLEVFFHGGISFAPYRARYEKLCDMSKMHFVDTYNASEGFFAAQNEPDDTSMLLLTNTNVFYEFIPCNAPDSDPIPLWELHKGDTYEMIITSCNGLWRYRLGDTVKIESISPAVKLTIAGRTKHYINAFGEELMVHNADAAIDATSRITGIHILNYTAAPLFPEGNNKGRHQWLIEFADQDITPSQIAAFADTLDNELRKVNSDYDAKRTGNIFLAALTIIQARRGVFDRWLQIRTGRLGGQRKVPRLSNNREIIDTLLTLNTPNT